MPGCQIREYNEGTATLPVDVKTYVSRPFLVEGPKGEISDAGRTLGEA